LVLAYTRSAKSMAFRQTSSFSKLNIAVQFQPIASKLSTLICRSSLNSQLMTVNFPRLSTLNAQPSTKI
jgi:hypothetical protein